MVVHELGISTKSCSSPGVSRRELLLTTAITLIFSTTSASALDVKGSLPWSANAGSPPTPVPPGPWVYFTTEEGAAVEALVDRLIPPDPQTPGARMPDVQSSSTDNLRDRTAKPRGYTCAGLSPTEHRNRAVSLH